MSGLNAKANVKRKLAKLEVQLLSKKLRKNLQHTNLKRMIVAKEKSGII